MSDILHSLFGPDDGAGIEGRKYQRHFDRRDCDHHYWSSESAGDLPYWRCGACGRAQLDDPGRDAPDV